MKKHLQSGLIDFVSLFSVVLCSGGALYLLHSVLECLLQLLLLLPLGPHDLSLNGILVKPIKSRINYLFIRAFSLLAPKNERI